MKGESMKVNENRIIRYLSAIAFADFTRFAETITAEDGSQCLVIKDTSQLTSSERCAISSMKVGTKGIEVKLYDRLKAIEGYPLIRLSINTYLFRYCAASPFGFIARRQRFGR